MANNDFQNSNNKEGGPRLHYCVLTGYPLKMSKPIDNAQPILIYEFEPIGKVKIGLPTLLSFITKKEFKHPILAGICRAAYEKGEDPPIITGEYIHNDLKNNNYPKTFQEKSHHLLKMLYQKGGNEYQKFNIGSHYDYPLCFSNDSEEFERIMDYLEDKFWISWEDTSSGYGKHKLYYSVKLTEYGINEVERELPKLPMIGLVDQVIVTGDPGIDERVNHAKKLFFDEPQTHDNMRSACEALSFILEPLRKNLQAIFLPKDVEALFQIINTFDIRHNRDHLKKIDQPELLEWVFYSLLNTISTYVKMKNK